MKVCIAIPLLLLVGCPRCKSAPEAPPPVDTVRQVVMVFGGDVMQHSQQVRAARQTDGIYSYDSVFQYIAPIFKSADLAIVNLETTLAEGPPYSGYPLFRSPAALALGMAKAFVDVALLANNHICDAGAAGIRNTIAALDSVEIKTTGAWAGERTGYPLVLSAGGFDIQLLNYTYSTNGNPVPRSMTVNMIDTTLIANDLAQIVRTDTTLIIVALHWGNEYQRHSSAEQRELAAWLHSKGVDIVVGSHPHVVQEIDYEAVTIYSLGNLVSAQRKPYTDRGLMVRITVTLTPNIPRRIEIEPIPTRVRLPDYVIMVDTI